ncbi:MAG TPA: deoxyribodipyrimidine photo-lyase, partial [Mariniphaga sp.]|nr:deoxyribodipyrimidine photo-lyase [Mariniphaga sp.]
MKEKLIIYWFRNDLRINDNHGLYQALQMDKPVLPVFIFDFEIIKTFTTPSDKRMAFMYELVKTLKQELESYGSSLKCFFTSPLQAFKQLLKDYTISEVVTTKEYEPYDRQLEGSIQQLFDDYGITFYRIKDRVIFEENEVVTNNGTPYTVFTPYSKKWKSLLMQSPPEKFPSENLINHFKKSAPFSFPSLEDMGFIPERFIFPSKELNEDIIENYALYRDYPAIQGTTRLGVHIRYGTISIRQLVIKAQLLSEVFLNELIWRE